MKSRHPSLRLRAVCLLAAATIGLAMLPGAMAAPTRAADPSDSPRESWETDGTISAIVSDGATAYIGGEFTNIGPVTGGGVAISISTARHDPQLPRVAGPVSAVISDGQGGWFIGGEFTAVGGQPRRGLAHIRGDRTLDPGFAPNPDGSVKCLLLSGATLYVGGSFTTISGGAARSSLAAVDIATGTATGFNPNVRGAIFALALRGSTLYVGGAFDSVNGGVPRRALAALDTATGLATSFDPGLAIGNASVPSVSSLILDGPTLYAGGNFWMINGGIPRGNIAAFDLATGGATALDPRVDGPVAALALSGRTLYIGGIFGRVNTTTSRQSLAAIDTATGAATPFAPHISGSVTTLAVSGAVLYVGGRFAAGSSDIAGHHLAAFDTATGRATPFDPRVEPGGAVDQIALAGDTLYAGGTFYRVGVAARSGLAAIDLFSGEATAFAPTLIDGRYGSAHALALRGRTLFVGGSFTAVNGGVQRGRIAAFDTLTGAVTDFNPNITDSTASVYALQLSGSTLYAGGYFTTVNQTTTRHSLAAFDTATGLATPFDPDVDGLVASLAISGTTLYAGGSFTLVSGGLARTRLAAFDTATGRATPFDPRVGERSEFATGIVSALAISGTTLYAGGRFLTVNGDIARSHLAAFDTRTGTATPFAPAIDGAGGISEVTSLALSNTALYVGGMFTSVDGSARQNLAALNRAGGVTPFAPAIALSVRAIHATPTDLLVGAGESAWIARQEPSLVILPFPGAPLVVTRAARGVTRASAALGGAISARGVDLQLAFELTLISGDYAAAMRVPALPAAAQGDMEALVSGEALGLVPGQTYYYRLVASGDRVSAVGAERAFVPNDPARMPLIVRP